MESLNGIHCGPLCPEHLLHLSMQETQHRSCNAFSSRQVAFKLGSMRILFQLKWPLQNKIGTPYFQSGYIIHQSCYNKSVGSIHTVVWRYHKSRWPTWSDCLFDLSSVPPPPARPPLGWSGTWRCARPTRRRWGRREPSRGWSTCCSRLIRTHRDTPLPHSRHTRFGSARRQKLHCGEHPQLENLEKVVMCVCTKCWMVKEF